ncbi:hypothetical protein GYMLUDRAFT_56023 [Collybiopsis luxurians FD-317 M1]|nr:hypothetical protein GYMLUDRAFT_56023 [Collybiopsis luxurians FD-317 M1]
MVAVSREEAKDHMFHEVLMPKQLTTAKKEYAKTAAMSLFHYDCVFEENAAVLHKDPNQFLEVYNTQKKIDLPPENFMPQTRAERDQFVTQAEDLLQKGCKTLLDHIHATSAALFLSQKVVCNTQDQGFHAFLETLHCKTQMQCELPYIVDPSTLVAPPNLSQTSYPTHHSTIVSHPAHWSDTHLQFPPAMPVETSFAWSQVDRQSAIHVMSQQIAQWKQNPEPLQQQQIFIAEVDEEEKAFKVMVLMTTEKERVFYVQFVDNNEAIGYLNNYFFEMLAGAMQVKLG